MKKFIKSTVLSFFISSIILTIVIIGYLFFNDVAGENFTFGKYAKATIPNNLNEDKIVILNTTSTKSSSKTNQPDILGTIMAYTSFKYGINFNYLTNWIKTSDLYEGKPIYTVVSRNKNKICITYDINKYDDECNQGQFIEIFSKNPKNSFKDAILNNFIQANINCKIRIYEDRSYEIAEVSTESSNCIGKYAGVGRKIFFQYSPDISNKFILVSLNQYPIYADTNYTPWEKTLEIFK